MNGASRSENQKKNMEIGWAHVVRKFDFLPGDVLSWSVKECNDTWPAAVGSDRNGLRVRTDWMVWMARAAAASVTEEILMDSGVKLVKLFTF